jgi:hypothetical protein
MNALGFGPYCIAQNILRILQQSIDSDGNSNDLNMGYHISTTVNYSPICPTFLVSAGGRKLMKRICLLVSPSVSPFVCLFVCLSMKSIMILNLCFFRENL